MSESNGKPKRYVAPYTRTLDAKAYIIQRGRNAWSTVYPTLGFEEDMGLRDSEAKNCPLFWGWVTVEEWEGK